MLYYNNQRATSFELLTAHRVIEQYRGLKRPLTNVELSKYYFAVHTIQRACNHPSFDKLEGYSVCSKCQFVVDIE